MSSEPSDNTSPPKSPDRTPAQLPEPQDPKPKDSNGREFLNPQNRTTIAEVTRGNNIG